MTKRRIVLVAAIVVVVVVIAVPVLLVPLLPLSSLHTDTHTCASSCATHTHTHSVAPILALPISVGGAANSVLKPHVEAASDCASASVDALRAFLAKRCNSQIQLQIHLRNMKANGGHLSDSPEIVCSRVEGGQRVSVSCFLSWATCARQRRNLLSAHCGATELEPSSHCICCCC